MPDREAYEVVGRAMMAACAILATAGRELDGVVLLVELDGEGVIIAASDEVPKDRLSTILAEASFRAAAAGA
jgi:hypothetical protein